MKTILTLLSMLWTVSLYAQTSSNDSLIFVMVEEMPQYAGGQEALLKYLGTIAYPDSARENAITGAVFAKFVIEKDGAVSNVTVAKSSGYAILDSAVVNHVRLMPAWKPGMQQGKPVRVEYVVPIKFSLVGGLKPKKKNKRDD